MAENNLVSLVIPVYNEKGNIVPLMEDIERACSSINYEILAVDDGSTDGTREDLKELSARFPRLKPIFLRGNFGQTAAMAAGIDHAQGHAIITLDGDRQNDPADIPVMLDHFEKGFDVVSGWRKSRKDALISRKIPSWAANALISKVTGVNLHDYGCTLKCYRASLIKDIQLAGEMHRFLPAWCAWRGGKIKEIPVNHHPRTVGQTKYGIFRIFKVIIDLMTIKFFSGYLSKPSYLFSGIGLFFLFMGALAGGAAFVDKFVFDHFAQYRIPLLLLSVFAGLAALFLFAIGVISELLVRLYFSVRSQKPYVLENEIRA